MLGGFTALVIAFLYLPIVVLVVYSFNASDMALVWEGLSFRWYAELYEETRAHLADERRSSLIAALWNSTEIAAATTALSIALGTSSAWLLHRHKARWLRAVRIAAYVPMILPEILLGISLLVLFKTVRLDLGFLTVILAHTTFCFPFVMVTVQSRLAGLDPSLEEAAQDLGATPTRAFFSVIVPYLLPAIIAGGLLSFTLSFDELVVTYFTRGPTSETLPVKVYGMARVGLSPALNTISTVLIVLTAMMVALAEALKKVYTK
ncbi:MAG: ABC transporter permease [Polyangiaceae bacterium]|nr:ABC transporter permease [Polyangiaceae bacterium]